MITMITTYSAEGERCEARLLARWLVVGRHQHACVSIGVPGPGFSMRCRGPKVSETVSLLGDRGTYVQYTIPAWHLPKVCASCGGSWREGVACLGVGRYSMWALKDG